MGTKADIFHKLLYESQCQVGPFLNPTLIKFGNPEEETVDKSPPRAFEKKLASSISVSHSSA